MAASSHPRLVPSILVGFETFASLASFPLADLQADDLDGHDCDDDGRGDSFTGQLSAAGKPAPVCRVNPVC